MNPRRALPAAAALLLVPATAATAFALDGPGADAAGAPAKVTKHGVGGIRLGTRHSALRSAGLVRKLGPGCELAGPGTHAAGLRSPLKGSVDYRKSSPPRVKSITVTAGATARGVGIGDKVADIKAAYPGAKVDHGTDDTFGFSLVKVPKASGGRITFAVDTSTKKITTIGVPFIALCE